MIVDLNGLRVLNTRPCGQHEALSHAIVKAGGVAIECPLLAIERIVELTLLHDLADLENLDQIIFISRNAVSAFFDLPIHWPEGIRVVAIGRSTAEALLQHGVQVDEVPLLANSEYLLILESMQMVQHQTIAIVKGEGGRTILADTLNSRGARVIPINVYRRVLPKINPNFLHALWREDTVDVIVLTSEQAMLNLFRLFDIKAHDWLRQKSYWVVSERLAKAVACLGIKKIQIMKGLIDD